MEIKLLVCLCLCCLCLISGVISIALPYWLYVRYDDEVWHEGLWQVCGGDLCIPFATASVTGHMIATMVFDLLGLGLIAVALICATLKFTLMKHRAILTTTAATLMTSAGILMSIGTMIYATKVRDERDEHKLYYFFVGFYVSMAAAMTSVATGAAFFLLDRLTAEYDVLGNREPSDSNLPGLSHVGHYGHT